METNQQPAEKIYVAIGTDINDGFATLEWTLKNWASHAIKIVILYADNISRNYVYSPIGKIPSSYANEEKLKVLDQSEEAKSDKILSSFIGFCGEVKAEGLRIDRYEEPMYKVILKLISSLRITKLVMAFSFLRPLSWTSKSAISASFYLHRQKPDFCELFVIFNGKLVSLKDETNEGFIEDDQGVIVAKLRERPSFKNWIGKFFPENSNGKSSHCDSPSSSASNALPDQWEKHVQEIEHYFNELSSSIAQEEDPEEANDRVVELTPELNMAENKGSAEKLEILKIKIRDTLEIIQSNKKEAKANTERCAKAKWAVDLCSSRADELEAYINEENAKRVDLQRDLDTIKEELFEIQSEVEEKRNKLNSILELQRELSNKLQLSTLAKSRIESHLENAVRYRPEVVREIEELRKQRDVLQRRIEFCKEKDAIEMANRLSDLGFDYRKFTAAEIRTATDDFSERLRLKSAGDWTNVYKGSINRTTVAIKMPDSDDQLSQETFLEKVKLLSHIRHPHILSMIGFCTELKCIVFEYMHNGCLRDTLFSCRISSRRSRNHALNWHARIRIAAEVCMGLSFLHNAQPTPIIQGNLNPSKILLDRNNVARIYGLKPCPRDNEFDNRADIRAFGTLLLQLLTGRNWAGIGEEAITEGRDSLTEALDKTAGKWPLNLAVELGGIARRCLAIDESLDEGFSNTFLMRWIKKVRKKADELLANGEENLLPAEVDTTTEGSNAPSVFFCPIYQDVMKNPHVAADGFSYELEAIEEWIRTGHDTSPMTKSRLKHKQLMPNHTLRSLIQEWHHRRSVPYS